MGIVELPKARKTSGNAAKLLTMVLLMGAVSGFWIKPIFIFGIRDAIGLSPTHGFDFAGATVVGNVLFVTSYGHGEFVHPKEAAGFCDDTRLLGGDDIRRHTRRVGWCILVVVVTR